MKLTFGEKRITRPVVHQDDADEVWGDTWHAWRDGGRYVLDYLTGDHAGSQRRLTIGAEEFERLRIDARDIKTIIRAHCG